MSSSHLFLGLRIALLILYLVLSSGFQSAAFPTTKKGIEGSASLIKGPTHMFDARAPLPCTKELEWDLVEVGPVLVVLLQ